MISKCFSFVKLKWNKRIVCIYFFPPSRNTRTLYSDKSGITIISREVATYLFHITWLDINVIHSFCLFCKEKDTSLYQLSINGIFINRSERKFSFDAKIRTCRVKCIEKSCAVIYQNYTRATRRERIALRFSTVTREVTLFALCRVTAGLRNFQIPEGSTSRVMTKWGWPDERNTSRTPLH